MLFGVKKRRENSDDIYMYIYFNKKNQKIHYNLLNPNKIVFIMPSNGIKANMMKDIFI